MFSIKFTLYQFTGTCCTGQQTKIMFDSTTNQNATITGEVGGINITDIENSSPGDTGCEISFIAEATFKAPSGDTCRDVSDCDNRVLRFDLMFDEPEQGFVLSFARSTLRYRNLN